MKTFSADEIFTGRNDIFTRIKNIFTGRNDIFTYNTTQEDINKNEEIEIIGDIPDDAKINIKGITEETRTITGKCTVTQIEGGGKYIQGDDYVHSKTKYVKCVNLTINGNVGNNVTILSQGGGITISGDVGKHSSIETTDSPINVGNVGNNATLETTNDDITVGYVDKGATIKTTWGNINLRKFHKDAILKTKEKINITDDKRSRTCSSSSSSFSDSDEPSGKVYNISVTTNIDYQCR